MTSSPSSLPYAAAPPARGRSYRPPGPAWLWAVRIAALVAAGVSAYMLYVSLTQSGPAGCGSDAGCGSVLTSRWSKWIYLPVSALALPLYAAVFFATLAIGRPMAPPRRERRAWGLLAVLAALAAGAAVWFVALQLLAVRGLCPYCMAVHACGLAVAGLVFTRLPVGRPPPPHEPGNPVLIPPGTLGSLLAVGGIGLAVLIVGQLFTPAPGPQVVVFEGDPPFRLSSEHGSPFTRPSTTQSANGEDNPPDRPDTPVAPKRGGPFRVYHNGAVEVDQSMFPVAGPPDAPHMLAVMADYTCPDCKRLHAILGGARRRYGDAIAVIVMPMPLDGDCNPNIISTQKKHENACELAKLALAVWSADPSKFAEMDEWLFENQPADPAAARRRAAGLVGDDALAEAEAGTAADAALRSSTLAYGAMGGGAVPKLMLPKVTAVGPVNDARDVYGLLEKHLGVKPADE